MTIWRTPAGTYARALEGQQPQPCPYADKSDRQKGCKQVGRLSVILPELWRAGFVGYVTMETHSIHDLINITAALNATMEARGDHPQGLRGILFNLRRSLEDVSTPRGDKRVTQSKWLVKIEPAAEWVTLQLEATRRLALSGSSAGAEPLALTDGRTADVVTGEIVEPPEDDGDLFDDELAQHWYDDPDTRRRWDAWIAKVGLAPAQLAEIFGPSVRDYGGSVEEARVLVSAYVERLKADAGTNPGK